MDIEKLINELTIEEKCRLLVGKDSWHTAAIERLDIPSIMMSDGPHGLRKQLDSANAMMVNESYKAVCFPPAVTVASSFDPKLAFKMGEAIANECLYKDVHVLLGPGLNIKRSPLCGRNFEYYSEDPHLSGEMAASFVKGVQSKNVGACLKHFALNSQETYRMTSSSAADQRAFHEIYGSAFKRAIQENPAMVMCSYNRVDDKYASENPWLLQDVLRNNYGFKNVIVSDWGAVNDRKEALKASLDLEMPGHPYAIKKLLREYKAGNLSIEEINSSVRKILELVNQKKDQKIIPFDLDNNHKIAYEIAKGSMVLLKNDDSILPLQKTDEIAIIGRLAKEVRYQGGGSSHINPYKVDSMLDYIPKGVKYAYADGYRLEDDGFSQKLIDEAKRIAIGKQKVILVIGLTDVYESEGYDRTHLNLPQGHLDLLNTITQVHDNVIVVLQIGSPIVMPWIQQVKAVFNAYLGGEAGAKAIMELLYGQSNPSGRLAETFPLSLESTPCHPFYAKGNGEVHYQESIYVGYRYYESKDVETLFPFGYGLSYTSFQYSNLKINMEMAVHPAVFTVSVDVTNEGFWIGKEVVQLYVQPPQTGVFKPKRELKRFLKIELQPHETKTVMFKIATDDLSYYDITKQAFVVEPGHYFIEIMKNAHEVILSQLIEIDNLEYEGSDPLLINASSYYIANGLTFADVDFERLLGRSKKDSSIQRHRPYHISDTLEDIRHTIIGRSIYRTAWKMATKEIKNMDETTKKVIEKSIGEVPMRSMAVFSGGRLKMTTLKGILELINHHPIKALSHFFGRD